MASQYASPFDALLDAGRRQFDALTGVRPVPGDIPVADAAAPRPPASRAPRPEPEAGSGTVVEGTAAGIAFKLKTG